MYFLSFSLTLLLRFYWTCKKERNVCKQVVCRRLVCCRVLRSLLQLEESLLLPWLSIEFHRLLFNCILEARHLVFTTVPHVCCIARQCSQTIMCVSIRLSLSVFAWFVCIVRLRIRPSIQFECLEGIERLSAVRETGWVGVEAGVPLLSALNLFESIKFV